MWRKNIPGRENRPGKGSDRKKLDVFKEQQEDSVKSLLNKRECY